MPESVRRGRTRPYPGRIATCRRRFLTPPGLVRFRRSSPRWTWAASRCETGSSWARCTWTRGQSVGRDEARRLPRRARTRRRRPDRHRWLLPRSAPDASPRAAHRPTNTPCGGTRSSPARSTRPTGGSCSSCSTPAAMPSTRWLPRPAAEVTAVPSVPAGSPAGKSPAPSSTSPRPPVSRSRRATTASRSWAPRATSWNSVPRPGHQPSPGSLGPRRRGPLGAAARDRRCRTRSDRRGCPAQLPDLAVGPRA